MNRSKKLFLTLTGSLLFLSPLTAKSALNKSVDDFSNINISEEIKEKSILNGLPKMIVFDEFRRYIERASDEVRMLERTIDMMRRDAPRESTPRRSSIMEVYEKNKQWGKLQMKKRSLQVQIEKNKDKWTKDFIRRKEYEIKKITEKIRKLQEKLKKDYENSN